MHRILNYLSPFGVIMIKHDSHHIYQTSLEAYDASIKYTSPSDDLSNHIFSQLDTYFSNPNFRFKLPLKLSGSSFRQSVLRFLQTIPPGRTVSYGDVAFNLQTSPRAVGQACRCNPIPLFIPCHRIVSKQGLGGFMGTKQAVTLKQAMLQYEGALTL